MAAGSSWWWVWPTVVVWGEVGEVCRSDASSGAGVVSGSCVGDGAAVGLAEVVCETCKMFGKDMA